jgi:hypothetical protein
VHPHPIDYEEEEIVWLPDYAKAARIKLTNKDRAHSKGGEADKSGAVGTKAADAEEYGVA